jgi:MtN3 and saliva related transmembrane protein
VKINYISIIGLLAGTLTTLSFLPQVVKAARTKETKDLSLSMYIVLATGIFLWTIYGILIEALPVILANGISFILAAIVLILKIKYG